MVPMEMDVVETIRTETVNDIPPIPIKTYKWEDIRRERRKGHYPYTYLHKEPYNGEIDPSEFKMDTLRPSKSASVLEKCSSGVNIQEMQENKDTISNKDYLDVSAAYIVETADSSNEDNISQYLDKEDDDLPVITEHIETPGPSKEEENMEVDITQEDRAKSEEPKRKRKLSIESSYSRISLSRLGMMKKLREAKERLKFPKFSFSKSESKLDIPKKTKKEIKKSSDTTKKKDVQTYVPPKKDEAPVYIHIPLKPPPGQTDEFSYLEFESRKPEPATEQAPTPGKPDEEITTEEVVEKNEQEGVQFIIVTAPSDDEILDDHAISPDTASSDGTKKFFDNAKLKELKSLAKGCVDDISPDVPIEGIIFEDVIQVEYVDEHNRPIGTTERSNFLEITEENLSTIEKQLSQRNLVTELQKEIASSMDSLNKIARQNTLKKLKEQQKARSNEALKKITNDEMKTQEAPELSTPVSSVSSDDKIKEQPRDVEIDLTKEEKKEVPKPSEEERQIEENKNKPMFDEEDGLKLSETAVQMINDELAKEKLPKTNEEQLKAAAKPGSIKKVSFKRRSKQEDPDGIYEVVRVTSDGKKVDGKDQQTKELKVIEPAKSMSVDEEKTYLDDKIIKTTSLEEDYNKWSKLNDHEYEPINPPVDNENQQLPSPQIEVKSKPVKRSSSKQSKNSNSIRIPLKDEDIVPSDEEVDSGDALTVEEMQARIEDQFFSETPQQEDATPPATVSSKESQPQESKAKKFQDAFKMQAGKISTKFRNIKKPNIQMPQRPNMERFKIQKPNIKMPKIPDQMRVNLPSFTLPKKGAKKRSIKERQFSTESNAGDSKKKLFDFSTVPRIFSRKKKPDDFDDDFGASATVPRAVKSSKKRTQNSGKAKEPEEKKKKSPDVIRIPLHSKESMDKEDLDLSSHRRYEEDIDMDDDYVKESQQMHIASEATNDYNRSRWNHGSFHGRNINEIEDNEMKVTDLDNEMELPQTSPEPELEPELEQERDVEQELEIEQDLRQERRSISSSDDFHRHGVLEKINSDEFFYREKGISQDNIQTAALLTAEIREAFKQPINSLAKLQTDDSFDREFDVSDHSIQEVPKRRPIKKPKRKKTPNVSRERIPYDQESEPEEYPKQFDEQPARPKRRSKQKKKFKDDRPPYQDTIMVQDMQFEVMRKAASDNVLSSDKTNGSRFHDGHFRQEYPQLYENERMQGIEQPNILISDPYRREEYRFEDDEGDADSYEKGFPEVPPRKQKSLKSLVSEHDSIIDEMNIMNRNLPQQNIEAYRVEHEYIIPTQGEAPTRPFRTRSRTRSQSTATNQPDDEPVTPTELEEPCVEEPCIPQVCDYMGYAVIEKNKHREPPLPPPTRRKKSPKSDTKFSTVPRPLKEDMPVRPIRNYSTLVPKSKRSAANLEDDEKENIDLGQYIEIEDDDGHSRLQSGDIVQKMKGRPLPAPPRPPRKSKDSDRDGFFKDITNKSNIDEEEPMIEKLEEAEVFVQTEPLPDDVVFEEYVQEKGDRVITPTSSKSHPPITEFENVETVTHGALVIAPIPDNFEEGPLTTFSRSTERIISIRREVDHEAETSDLPEDFKHLKEPRPQTIERPLQQNAQVEVLKAQKLQVSDLDVDRLTVNELLASKIKVSEIDSDSISVAEINPKSGNLVIGGVEFPIDFIQQIIEKLTRPQSSAGGQSVASEDPIQCKEHSAKGEKEQVKSEMPLKVEKHEITEHGVNLPSKPENVDLPSKPDLDYSQETHTATPSQQEELTVEEAVLFVDQQLPKKIEETVLLSEGQQSPLKAEETVGLSEDQQLPLKVEETVLLSEGQQLPSKVEETILLSKEDQQSTLKVEEPLLISKKDPQSALKVEDALLISKEDQQSALKVEEALLISKDQQLPLKQEATRLPSDEDQRLSFESEELNFALMDESSLLKSEECIDEDLSKISQDEAEKKLQLDLEEDSSSTTLKATIDYLNDLVTGDDISLELKEKIQQIMQEDLVDTGVESTSEPPIIESPLDVVDDVVPLETQSSVEEKSESVDLDEVPPLIPDTSEEDRLIEALKSSSQEQKKNSV